EGQAGADARLREVLGQLYDEPPAAARRLRAVPADLTAPGLGLSSADRSDLAACVTRVVHCAATISFTLPLAQARETNVEGTRRVLDLAREMPRLERVVHVSTAFVAGRAEGRFHETDLDVGQRFRNTYERTKAEAEHVVAESGLPAVVVRPSIVVGESDSGWTTAFNVVYWPLQAFARGLLGEVPADPNGVVDLVPVDRVAELLVAAAFDPAATGTLHAVAGEHALRVRDLASQASETLKRPPPALRAPQRPDGDAIGSVLAPYFDVHVTFDDRRAAALRPPPAEAFATLVRTIVDYAQAARWGKRPLTRQAARARIAAAQ
ncbi:MAG: SDR family oxidoreductase, partial [Actinomycetota bacterium]|nr:SDR family oxidoreductase [Actinomycetota bacterium]